MKDHKILTQKVQQILYKIDIIITKKGYPIFSVKRVVERIKYDFANYIVDLTY